MRWVGAAALFGLSVGCTARVSEPVPSEPRAADVSATSHASMDMPPAPSSSALATPPPADAKFELDDEVDKLRGAIRTAVAAEVVRGNARLAITWPAFHADGSIVDNDIATHPFHRVDGVWKPDLGLGRQLRDASTITEMIGGEGWTIVRPCGLPASELATEIPRNARSFDDAHRAKDLDAALLAYVRLTRAFSFEEVAYTHDIPRFLITRMLVGSTWACDEAAKSCTVDTLATTYEQPEKDGSTRTRDVKAAHGTFALEDCGGGKVVGAPRK